MIWYSHLFLPLVYAFVIHVIIYQKIIDSRNKKDIDRKKEKVIIKKKKEQKMEIIVDDVTNMPLVSANKLSLYSGYEVTLLPGEEKEVHTGVRI